jgi:peptide/nickel transport system ATP-binding protein
MALLEVRDLSIGVRRKKETPLAVDGLRFDIEAGEILGLAGESGCGKTLTALSILRLLPPGAAIKGGDIWYRPGILADRTAPLSLSSAGEDALGRIRGKEISIIFQEPRQSLNPLMRIGEQIAEPLELHGIKDRKAAKTAALDMICRLGLPEPERIFRAFPHQLSGGMCQRVMIGIAVICRPRLLIADEPTTALDAAVQDQILALLGEVNRDLGAAILFISHDLAVVRGFCRRFLVMYAGKIVEQGPAEALIAGPAHPYTRGLLGAIPGRDRRDRPLANIPGSAPSIEERLPGCSFAPRCPKALRRCFEIAPPETDLGGGRSARCFLAGESNV